MEKMNGVDVSGWQPANVLDLIQFDFAIVKITQGDGPSNKNVVGQLKSAKTKGVYGVYHYDNGNNDYRGEVDAFIAEAVKRDVIGKGILFWDWEDIALVKGVQRLANIRDYLKEKLGYTAIYTSGSPAKDNKAEISKWDYVWVAAYPSTQILTAYNPNITQSWWPTPIIHQYSSTGRLGNYKDNLDVDVAHISADEWKAVAAKAKLNSAKPQPQQPPVTSEPSLMPEELTVDAAIADGILTDRKYWVDVLLNRIPVNPAYIKIALDRSHELLKKVIT